ncbi:MAG TPA: hypothetical protein PKG77_05520 [Phycisphaerae bacterium]|nr:hypothetical protein [Phycisphaerae bacterium]HQL74818.1 hypothetical protein [Phycisphaerae bacterium]
MMTLRRLLWREILHRRLHFAGCVLAVAAAVACCAGTVLLLRSFDLQTESILADKRQASADAWAQFQDEMRKDMLKLGFNLMILHREHNLSDPEAQARTLSEDYAQKLAQAKPNTINHVLPFLQQKFWWPERNRWVTLMGTTGEVYIKSSQQKPMLQAVPQGGAILGYAIHKGLALAEGDMIEIDKRTFRVRQCLPKRGFDEDERVYVPLRAAQEMLKRPAQITGILAVNCHCGDPEDLLNIRSEVARVLPDTQVIEHHSKLLARAEVRSKSAREADREIERQAATRAELRRSRLSYGALLVPLGALGGAIILALLTFENVNRRRMEIGILMALGLTGGRIQAVFLAKAGVSALVGALAGYAAALAGVATWAPGAGGLAALAEPVLPLACAGGAILLSLAASWAPAQLAAGMDPAVVLLQEGA